MTPLRRTQHLHRPRYTASHDGPGVWLFDLDNTLHDSSRAIFKAINVAMQHAVAQMVGCDLNTADQLRILYWKRYGATVIGMVRHHGADPNEFLRLSHDFDIRPLVHSEPGLARKLAAIPGRKILLTNAPTVYARQVLAVLDLLPQFEALWSIDHMQLQGRIRPKPSLALMKQVLARLDVPARQVVLVEDTLRNLKSAYQLGMRTVHIFHPGTPFSSLHRGRAAYVDIRVNSLGQLLGVPYAWRIPGKPDHAGSGSCSIPWSGRPGTANAL